MTSQTPKRPTHHVKWSPDIQYRFGFGLPSPDHARSHCLFCVAFGVEDGGLSDADGPQKKRRRYQGAYQPTNHSRSQLTRHLSRQHARKWAEYRTLVEEISADIDAPRTAARDFFPPAAISAFLEQNPQLGAQAPAGDGGGIGAVKNEDSGGLAAAEQHLTAAAAKSVPSDAETAQSLQQIAASLRLSAEAKQDEVGMLAFDRDDLDEEDLAMKKRYMKLMRTKALKRVEQALGVETSPVPTWPGPSFGRSAVTAPAGPSGVSTPAVPTPAPAHGPLSSRGPESLFNGGAAGSGRDVMWM